MHEATPSFDLPTWAAMRWLAEPSEEVPAAVRRQLISTLFTSIVPALMGGIANVMVLATAAIHHPGLPFVGLLIADIVLLAARIWLLVRSRRAAIRGGRTYTDLLMLSSLLWAGIVGSTAGLGLFMGDPVIQVLAPVTAMSILSGIVTRNNGVPRVAMAQILLCDAPLKIGALCAGEPWMLIIVAQFPLFMIATVSTLYRLHHGYIAAVLAERESERRATHDALTGLLNRPGLMAALDRELRPEAGSDRALALLYLDLDGFKAVNDRLGHAAGDALLRRVADRLVATLPDTCTAARLGGDEFVILAPGLSARAALRLGKRIIAALSEPYAFEGGNTARIGASIGIAGARGDSAERLLSAADAALYRAKAAGKGCCVLAEARQAECAAA
ncbi:diguanylate cyclase domain-containing protein [Methylobacterium sp. ID0610]|uniref:diguanylate cyclase domain-containing protein n=1 Tax=Methylobacterium carpenticola TaxID=3344827 RepID=UPI0036CF2769